jgi:hypothetical protein
VVERAQQQDSVEARVRPGERAGVADLSAEAVVGLFGGERAPDRRAPA